MDSHIEPYRPSNADEGWSFISRFCEKCHHDDAPTEKYCQILGRTMGLREDDPDYPREWVIEDGSPRCTAFASKEFPLNIRDDRTIEMFPDEVKPCV